MSEAMEAPQQVQGRTPGAIKFTQNGHLLAIETPLGKDYVLPTALCGEEALSQLFSYQVDLLSTDHAIASESLIGRSVKILLRDEHARERPIHGMIARFRSGALIPSGFRHYTAEVVPWLWFLTQTSDCRIFQNLTVPQIIEQVFQTFGFVDYEILVPLPNYPRLEFCVQYRETAFNFVSRLMEQAGLFYFFRHEADRHVLVIADSNASFRDLPEATLAYVPGDARVGQVTSWHHSHAFRPGAWAQTDFDFEVPSKVLLTVEKTVLRLRNAQAFERFDYPGLYTNKDVGTRATRILMEAEEAAYHVVEGRGRYASLSVGGKFRLEGHPCQDQAQAFVVSRVRHVASDPTYFGNADEVPSYENSFEAIAHDVRFRPLRHTEKPFVHGPQTATVVGPPGEKIHTDKYGRVRVQFHWDRYGKRDDKSSCWIRVSQAWAGRGWGNFNLPHVGHEVVVSFLEGDPDQPLITGRVYNGENGIAMGMPANKTQSAIRDHSGNEILMEGKSGVQDIRVTAVKDMNVIVEHDYNETVKTANRTIAIQSGTHTETIKGDTTIRVTAGKLVHRVEANTADYFVAKDVTEIFGDQQSTTVANAISITSQKATISLQAAEAIQFTTGKSQMTLFKNGTISIVGEDISIVGNQTVKVGGKTITIQGGDATKIGVGNQNTAYDKAKVTTSGAGIASNAVGDHTVTGAVVKIN
jgi:type VI secretion system secreted protein VgrG